jgi:hypothetical protein
MSLKEPLGGTVAPATMTQLRDRLLLILQAQCAEAISPDKAKEMANVAGKIIKSAAVQSEWAQYRKDTSDIPFLK